MRMATCHPERRHYCKGMCRQCYDAALYARQQRPKREEAMKRGTEVLAGLDIREIPGLPGYGVDPDGGLWTRRPRGAVAGRAPGSLPWKRRVTRPGSGGYVRASAWYNRRPRHILVHRAVLEAFAGPCPARMEARHLNGRRADNRLVNLAWGTRLDNAADRENHGKQLHGSRSPNAKLTEDQVVSIRRRYAGGESSMLGMAHEYGVGFTTVWNVVQRRTWFHLEADLG